MPLRGGVCPRLLTVRASPWKAKLRAICVRSGEEGSGVSSLQFGRGEVAESGVFGVDGVVGCDRFVSWGWWGSWALHFAGVDGDGDYGR